MQQKAFILFGATGSLSKIKIFPALNELYKNGEIDYDLPIIAYGRKSYDPADFRKYLKTEIPNLDKKFLESVIYIEGDMEDGNNISQFLKVNKIKDAYCYFSLPPNMYIPMIDLVYKMFPNLNIKIALEKPFGTSLDAAQKLVGKIGDRRSSFYLVDHYLAKDAVINFPTDIDISKIVEIEISILEAEGVEGREVFYDQTGAGVDTIQNHALNMLDRLVGKNILSSLEYQKGTLVLGQYDGYLKNDLIPNDSKTETYFKAEFKYNGRIKIVVRSGKGLDKTKTFISIKYKNGEDKFILIKPNVNEIKSPHEYVVHDFVSDKTEFAVTIDEALVSWKVMDVIFKDRNKAKNKTYKRGASCEAIEI